MRRICPTRIRPPHNGQRVAEGQRAMQIQTDPFLGWTHIGGRQYLVRQLNDHKGSIEIEDLAGVNLKAYAEVCGELLARGHARSGDPQVIAGYLGSGGGFAEAMAAFGSLYADQTVKDWEQLKRSGQRRRKKARANSPSCDVASDASREESTVFSIRRALTANRRLPPVYLVPLQMRRRRELLMSNSAWLRAIRRGVLFGLHIASSQSASECCARAPATRSRRANRDRWWDRRTARESCGTRPVAK